MFQSVSSAGILAIPVGVKLLVQLSDSWLSPPQLWWSGRSELSFIASVTLRVAVLWLILPPLFIHLSQNVFPSDHHLNVFLVFFFLLPLMALIIFGKKFSLIKGWIYCRVNWLRIFNLYIYIYKNYKCDFFHFSS